ncbi:hypothetical protein DL93DRAFT_633059 [Clavulina sp. PMI_390]|nr:hypothetical protein DL93DRAFT_633059 [Clavulina sp. PMI_390]
MASRAESSSAARLRDSDSDAAGDARVRRPSSPVHIRSNSVTFGPPKDSPTPRRMDSPSKRYSGLHPRPSLANSRVSSSGALPKRTHSFSANDPNGDVPRPSSSRRNDGSKKKRSSRKSGTRRDARTIDYGLGLLDDPSMLDPATRARIAELEARVDDINPASLPPTQLDLPSPSHDPQQPPPPLLHLPAPVETPPRVEFPRQTPSPRLPSSPSWEDGPPLRPASSNRRRISSVFTDVKDKMGKHPSQRTTKPSNASPLESARAIQELRRTVSTSTGASCLKALLNVLGPSKLNLRLVTASSTEHWTRGRNFLTSSRSSNGEEICQTVDGETFVTL